MHIKKIIGIGLLSTILIAILLIVCAWSPWVNEEFAQQKAKQGFKEYWENSNDGCSINCENCGPKDTQKVLFGRKVNFIYNCGWQGDVVTTESIEIFVSFAGKEDYTHNPQN